MKRIVPKFPASSRNCISRPARGVGGTDPTAEHRTGVLNAHFALDPSRALKRAPTLLTKPIIIATLQPLTDENATQSLPPKEQVTRFPSNSSLQYPNGRNLTPPRRGLSQSQVLRLAVLPPPWFMWSYSKLRSIRSAEN